MNDDPFKFLDVILGWFLGLASTPIVMYFTAIVERRRFRAVLNEELRETRKRLVGFVFLLRSHLGRIDRIFLRWFEQEVQLFGPGAERSSSLEFISASLKMTDADLSLKNQKSGTHVTKSVPSVRIPYLSSNLDKIGLLGGTEQKNLDNLLQYIEILNSKVSELSEWNAKTFDVQTAENHDLASGNAEKSITAILSAAERAIECIKEYGGRSPGDSIWRVLRR